MKEGAKLVVDESLGTTGSTQDEAGGGQVNNDETNSADSTDIGYTKLSANDLLVLNYNAGSTASSRRSSLELGNTATGLFDTATNSAITLEKVGNIITGYSATGHQGLTIELESDGDVKVSQFRAIVNDNPANHDEHGSDSELLGAGKITLKVEITDKDGDTTSATLDLGNLVKFEDDGPKVTIALKEGASSWSTNSSAERFQPE